MMGPVMLPVMLLPVGHQGPPVWGTHMHVLSGYPQQPPAPAPQRTSESSSGVLP